jgi:hypothetical protein
VASNSNTLTIPQLPSPQLNSDHLELNYTFVLLKSGHLSQLQFPRSLSPHRSILLDMEFYAMCLRFRAWIPMIPKSHSRERSLLSWLRWRFDIYCKIKFVILKKCFLNCSTADSFHFRLSSFRFITSGLTLKNIPFA